MMLLAGSRLLRLEAPATRIVAFTGLFVVMSSELVAQQPTQAVTLTLRPAAVAGGCSMLSAQDAQPITSYGSVSASPRFDFVDPLPASAIVSEVEISVSMLSECLPTATVTAKLNPSIPQLTPVDVDMGSRAPVNAITSCSQQAHFRASTFDAVNVIGARVPSYIRGGQNSIVLGETGGGCGVFVEFMVVTVRYYIDVPAVVFDADGSSVDVRRILANTWRSDDTQYLSPFQQAIPLAEYRNGSVLLSGTLKTVGGAVVPNTKVYLRDVDPPDTAPFIPASRKHYFDYSDDPNVLYLLMGNCRSATTGAICTAIKDTRSDSFWWETTTDASGRFAVIYDMAGANKVGWNVVFQASSIPLRFPLYYATNSTPWTGVSSDNRCGPTLACSRSPEFVYTRRVYLEQDQMFKAGTFLSASAAAGASEIAVPSTASFATATPNAPVAAIIVNLTANPTAYPYTGADSYFEVAYVIGVGGTKKAPTLRLKQPLQHNYVFRLWAGSSRPIGAAIGVYQTAADVYPLDTALAFPLFKTLSTDYVALSQMQNAVPFIPFVNSCGGTDDDVRYCNDVVLRTFNSIEIPPQGELIRTARYNHHHLVSVRQGRSGDAGRAFMPVTYGPSTTPVPTYDGHPVAFIYHGQIATLAASGGFNAMAFHRETVAHELLHLHDANAPVFGAGSTPATFGHCNATAWDGGKCMMNTARTNQEKSDETVSPHNNPFVGSEIWQVLRRPEPLPWTHSDKPARSTP